ncbi:MAG: hypothetical protein K6G81_10240, partial [Lachnospiraceae bacterium]|nr:hypothetical protein [Lachnospiraceae bacterium]
MRKCKAYAPRGSRNQERDERSTGVTVWVKPKWDRGNVSLANLPPVLFGFSPRIRVPRPVKINIGQRIKNKKTKKYAFS